MDAKKGVVVVDEPAWMLVEATGDSEVDAKIKPVDGGDDDDDDAESCISDVPEESRHGDKKNQEVVAGQEEKMGVDEQKEKAIICKNKSSTASVDSTEDEKNRLFWEACLAS